MLRRVAAVRTYASEEGIASIVRIVLVFLRGVFQLPVTVNAVIRALILFNPTMKATRSSETLALTRTTRRNIPESDILHIHRH
jgi:hypothetical protein